MASITVLNKGTAKEHIKVTYEQKVYGSTTRKRKSKTFPVGTKMKEIKAFMRKVETEYAMASGVDLEYYDITLEEFLPYFIEHMESQLSPSTIRTSLQAINSKEIGIKKFFGNKKMRQIKTIDVQNYVRFLEKHKTKKDNKFMSPKSIRNYVYVLSSMIEYAMKVGYMERKQNPCRYVELPKKVQKEIEVYTAEEAKEVLQILA